MWVIRESLRLVGRITIAVLIAIVIAESKALISGGDTLWTFRIMCMLLGAFFLLLGAAPAASLGGRRMSDQSWRLTQSLGYGRIADAPGPKLTATAVFVGSGMVLLALGAVL